MNKATLPLAHATQNRLNSPVLHGTGIALLEIGTLTATYPTKEKLIREEHRVVIRNAFAALDNAESVPVLMERYAKADPDTRCYTLKTLFAFYGFHLSYFLIHPSSLNYSGTPKARAFIAEKGPKDEDEDCQWLAERIGKP